VQPFDPEELVARVRALMRRASVDSSPILQWGLLTLDPSTSEANYAQRSLAFTPKEYSLIELLMRNPRRVFSCGMVLEHLWAYEDAPGEEAVRTHVKCIRQKLKAAGAPADVIETVYGIGYRLKPDRTPRKSSSSAAASPRQQTLLALESVWKRFQPRIAEQIECLNKAATALDAGSLSAELQQLAEREAHSLAGALGTFGLSSGSQIARNLEQQLQPTQTLRPQHAQQLQSLIQELRQVLHQKAEANPTPTSTGHPPQILVVDSDQPSLPLLIHEASQWGYQVKMTTALAEAMTLLRHDPPSAILLDPDIEPDFKQIKRFITQVTTQYPTLPMIVLTHQEGLSNRLKVARLGICRFLKKPMVAAQILEAVQQVLQQTHPPEAKIMIVDDDPIVLNTLISLLDPWGFSLTTLTDPRRFLDVLNAVHPDLLILDIKMPHISGIDLCQVVRNDPRWSALPILVLTAHTTPEIVTQVFTVGADDFVSKPIAGPELVVRILNRLERVKLLQRLANIDLLTGVANRHKSTQDLIASLQLAQQAERPLCLVYIDLDQLQHINRTYSHETGDNVLRQFGRRLLKSFSSNDIIGRWGGEEFVIGLYGMTGQAGQQRIYALMEDIFQHPLLSTADPDLKISFCAGIAEYPAAGDTLNTLYQAAEQALHQAKDQGPGHIRAAKIALSPPDCPRTPLNLNV
jgi:diguanylate cyclase (GGDEF)-like protein